MIEVKKIIQKNFAVSSDDAKKVQEEIKKHIELGNKIVISFANIDMLISHFLNVSIGELYFIYKDRWGILDNIEFINMKNDDLKLLKERIIPSFKNNPSDKEKFKLIQEDILK